MSDWTDLDTEFLLFGSRTCNACGRTLPASSEFFHRDANEQGGLSLACAECRNGRAKPRDRSDYQREKYASDPAYREMKKRAAREYAARKAAS